MIYKIKRAFKNNLQSSVSSCTCGYYFFVCFLFFEMASSLKTCFWWQEEEKSSHLMFKYIFIAFFIAMCSHNYGQGDMGEIHISFNIQCVIEYLCLLVDTWFYSVCSMGNSLIKKLMDSSIPDLWAPHSAYKTPSTVSILSGSTVYNFPLCWTLFLHRKNARYGKGQLQMDSQFCLMNHLYCLW